MAQQTAVEWLIEQLKKNENIRWRGAPVSELTEQAKAMEKEQIEDAFQAGKFNGYEFVKEGKEIKDPSKYFNETFKK